MELLKPSIHLTQKLKLQKFLNGYDDKVIDQLKETFGCPIGVTNVTDHYALMYLPNRLMFAIKKDESSYYLKFSSEYKIPLDFDSEFNISKQTKETIKSTYDKVKDDLSKARAAFDIGSIFPYTVSIYTPKSPFKIRTVSTKAMLLFTPYDFIIDGLQKLVKSEDQVDAYLKIFYPRLKKFERYVHKIAYYISKHISAHIHPGDIVLMPQMNYRKEIYKFFGLISNNKLKINEDAPMNTVSFLTKVLTFNIVSIARQTMIILLKDRCKIYYVNEKKSSNDLLGYPLTKRSTSPFDRARILNLPCEKLNYEGTKIKVIDQNTATTLNLLSNFNQDVYSYIQFKLGLCHNPYDEFITYDFTKECLRNITIPVSLQQDLKSKCSLEGNNLVPKSALNFVETK